ncbi:MAG: phospho-N-acetylmuramoyl-pentapeptide-transferase [Clostridiales bacterium]|nr:phospho-N-acetylmuramoyl-pentapeptide-transferase [Clostridiales bacterium]
MYYLQAGLPIIIGTAAGTVFTWFIIPVLRKMHTGQNIREDGPGAHLAKAGTPTMGGIAIIAAVVLTCLVTERINGELVVILTAFVLFGLLGFFDDYLKVARKRNLGLRAWQKLVLQTAIGLVIALSRFSRLGTAVLVPMIGKYWDFGIWYVPFITFTVVAMANSVNLTDGLDGLAAGVTSITSLFFAIVGAFSIYVGGTFCGALAGACLGFLVFNRNPAKVFMGDTGSLALGGGLAAAVIAMRLELVLPIAGFVYVAEALSVIIQVASFKTTGRRVFKMSPLHHHFELSGMSEKNVVRMFWAATALFCVAGLMLIKW